MFEKCRCAHLLVAYSPSASFNLARSISILLLPFLCFELLGQGCAWDSSPDLVWVRTNMRRLLRSPPSPSVCGRTFVRERMDSLPSLSASTSSSRTFEWTQQERFARPCCTQRAAVEEITNLCARPAQNHFLLCNFELMTRKLSQFVCDYRQDFLQ